jgi:hypothetical protein
LVATQSLGPLFKVVLKEKYGEALQMSQLEAAELVGWDLYHGVLIVGSRQVETEDKVMNDLGLACQVKWHPTA